MTPDQIAKRLAELRELAKQHESILLQISGAIQEYNNILAQMSTDKSMEDTNATDKIDDKESA